MKKVIKGALIAGAVVAAPAVINSVIFSRARSLGNVLGGEARFWPWREGDLFVTRTGKGKPPIVLVHGVYAGAGSFEWRKNFAALGEHFTVYALDFLGFGLSDKPRIEYTGELYVEMLCEFLKSVVGEPCAVVASSFGAAYAIEAASRLPDQVSDLILVCPAGLDLDSDECAVQRKAAMKLILDTPILGTSVYNGITSIPSLRYYLSDEVYFDPSHVTDEVVEHYSTASHQYGSQYAALAFISGQLGIDIRESLPKLTKQSIRLVWGREAKITPIADAQAFLAANPRAELTILDRAGGLPQDEQASAFNRFVIEALGAAGHSDDASGGGAEAKTKGRPRPKKPDA